MTARPAPLVPELRWALHAPLPEDPHEVGAELSGDNLVRSKSRVEGSALVEDLEAPGGPAFLVVERGPCAPSIVPLASLPGYAQREKPRRFSIHVPSCAASHVDVIELSGTFIHGGAGEPPAPDLVAHPASSPERTLELPPFRIDRTEVTNAAFEPFGALKSMTGVAAPTYPKTPELVGASEPLMPVAGIDWFVARAFCRFHGKDLPTSPQWTRALRGPLQLANGPNPMPRRNFPWGARIETPRVRLGQITRQGPARVGSSEDDRSVDGVMDLAGNVQEWTTTVPPDATSQIRVARGGNFIDAEINDADFTATENVRVVTLPHFGIGMRCVAKD
jgi:formylglycine-generating enzyme required for sulfatase activity